jgi:histone deacetylase 1/2
MSFDFTESGEAKITMCKYVEDLVLGCKIDGVADTPCGNNLFDPCETAPKLTDVEAENFHSYVAKCLYLAKRVRPDILLTVSFLVSRVQAPNKADWKKLVRLLKYLNGTKDMGIVLRPGATMQLEAYVDASYGIHADAKSHSALHLAVGSGNILAKSTKQKLVCKSSTEAELVALSDMCSSVIWVREFLIGQGEEVAPATLYQDNQSTMAMIERGKCTADRSRHIKIRYFWVKDRVDMGDVRIVYKPTESMIADLLTKPLQGEQFKQLRKLLLNWCY